MVKRFLITTPLEETWPDDAPVLFLGEWCRLYSRQEKWLSMDAEVMPYHWDDRTKFDRDYLYLRTFYEQLLQDLTGQLNEIHSVNHSLRYWRILIGPWLSYFTQVLFDRWTAIHNASTEYELTGSIVLSSEGTEFIPNDMHTFTSLPASDRWNHYIYGVLLQSITTVPILRREPREEIRETKKTVAIPWQRRVKRRLVAAYAKTLGFLTRDSDAFLIATYLPFRDEMKMHLRLGQAPQLWRSITPIHSAADPSKRNWSIAGDSASEFEALARRLIPQQIPVIYLEGYASLTKQVAGLPWPKHPRLIWTSSAHTDDVFKAWAAQKVENGAPLIIGQHGGLYGVGRHFSLEEHETAISDCYLSWGWTDPDRPHIKPVGQLKSKRPLGVKHEKQTNALLVTAALPRYSYHLYSSMLSRQWLEYFADQCSFVENLPVNIQRALTVRLKVQNHGQNYGWGQVSRWHTRFPSLRLDKGDSDINDLMRQSRLYISTYNAATYLESISMDIPTVIFWNPNHWELRESAVPYFEDLKGAGIFHETPESAAQHVAMVWDDVDSWWNSELVRRVLARFMAQYCSSSRDLLEKLDAALHEVTHERSCLRLMSAAHRKPEDSTK